MIVLLGMGGFFLFIVLVIGGCGLYANSLRNEGVTQERALSSQYLDNQNFLSGYISGFYEQVGVAQASTDALDRVLTDAVKGRYDGKTSAQPGTGSLFSAIAEAYPELSAQELLRIWGKIQDYVTSQREGYRNKQSKLLDMLRTYDTWRETGGPGKRLILSLGIIADFPSNNLEARIGETKLTGEVARDKMYQIVLDSTTLKAYETGKLDPLKIPTVAPAPK